MYVVMAVFCMPFTFTMTMLGHWVFSAPMCLVKTPKIPFPGDDIREHLARAYR